MATSSETLRQGKRMSSSAWAILVVVGLLATALAVTGYAISTRSTSEPAVATTVAQSDTVAPVAAQEGALIKGGLQPRPYATIAATPEPVTVDTPDGFIRVGTDFRPMPIQQRP